MQSHATRIRNTALLLLLLAPVARAQFDLEDSRTTASLRGIHSLGSGVAWASGTEGTVLRTEDGGYLWQGCATPPGAEKLDFRGIQAFDANTAIVMSSGKGDLSRLYKTTDGCRTWRLLFTNPDKEGFWDAMKFDSSPARSTVSDGVIVGDPVDGIFPIFTLPLYDGSSRDPQLFHRKAHAIKGESLFAASNSSIYISSLGAFWLGTGGAAGAYILRYLFHDRFDVDTSKFQRVAAPIGAGTVSSGVFSLAFIPGSPPHIGVAVGGDYLRQDSFERVAAFSVDAGAHWAPAQTPPHGYRSSVVYDSATRIWITTGPNGTDISTDDGKNWRPLKPGPGQPADADKNWNALSLPFVVGPHGRIGKLRDDALVTAKP